MALASIERNQQTALGLRIPSTYQTSIEGAKMNVIAVGSHVYDEDAFYAYRKLRADTYLSYGFIDIAHVDTDGGEKCDEDDERSVHFLISTEEKIALGAMRCIIRGNKPLPLENFFFDPYEQNNDYYPLATSSLEASRFMANHASPRVKRTITAELVGALLHFAKQNEMEIYATLEKPTKKLLSILGLSFTQIGPEKELYEYGDTLNAPYHVDIDNSYRKVLGQDGSRSFDVGSILRHAATQQMHNVHIGEEVYV